MENNLTLAEVFIVGTAAAGTAIWGWFGWLVILWAGCMILDYISGSLAAAKNHEWNSEMARSGLWHKLGMIFAVLVAGIADLVIGLIIRMGGITLPFEFTVLLSAVVTAWYTLTELGSIAENAVRMGAKVPAWLTRILKISADAVDKAGEKLAGKDKSGEEQGHGNG